MLGCLFGRDIHVGYISNIQHTDYKHELHWILTIAYWPGLAVHMPMIIENEYNVHRQQTANYGFVTRSIQMFWPSMRCPVDGLIQKQRNLNPRWAEKIEYENMTLPVSFQSFELYATILNLTNSHVQHTAVHITIPSYRQQFMEFTLGKYIVCHPAIYIYNNWLFMQWWESFTFTILTQR